MQRRPWAVNAADSVDRSTGAVGNHLPDQPRSDPTLAVGGLFLEFISEVGLSAIGASVSGHSLGAQGVSRSGRRRLQFSKETRAPAPRSSPDGAARSALPFWSLETKLTGGQRLWGAQWPLGTGQSPSRGPGRWAAGEGPGAAVTAALPSQQGAKAGLSSLNKTSEVRAPAGPSAVRPSTAAARV